MTWRRLEIGSQGNGQLIRSHGLCIGTGGSHAARIAAMKQADCTKMEAGFDKAIVVSAQCTVIATVTTR